MRASILVVSFFFASMFPAAASADALTRPPSCPAGQAPVLCHSGGVALCGAQHCTSDGECSSGMVCRLRSVCTTVCPRADAGGAHIRGDILSAECDPGTTCGGSDCADERVCVASGTGSASGSDGGPDGGGVSLVSYGCDVSSTTGIGGGVLVLVAVIAWAAVRRRS